MKYILVLASLWLSGISLASEAPREIRLKTEKKGDVVHWMPEKIEVTQGETVKFLANHDLEGGFDFHGLFIPELKISETVTRHKQTTVEKTIPNDLKPGEYKVGCQFHPKHVPTTLVVKAKSK